VAAVGTGGGERSPDCYEVIQAAQSSSRHCGSSRRIRTGIFKRAGQALKKWPRPHPPHQTRSGKRRCLACPKNLHLKDAKGALRSPKCIQVTNAMPGPWTRRLAKEEGILAGFNRGECGAAHRGRTQA